jgi:hypothetical protein
MKNTPDSAWRLGQCHQLNGEKAKSDWGLLKKYYIRVVQKIIDNEFIL